MRTGLPLHADDLMRLVEGGVLAREDRVELLDGEVVWMAPIRASHFALVVRLTQLLSGAAGLVVSAQGPLRLGDDTELYPDLCLVRETLLQERRVPAVRDALLVVEVSDTTLAYDLGTKRSRYARAGVPELWIVDVEAGIVRTYRDPGGDGYRSAGRAMGADRLAPVAAPTLVVPVVELFADIV